MRSDKQKDYFTSEFMKIVKDREFISEELYFIAGALMEAGSDTTRVSLHEVIACSSVLFPDWVERARKELDAVCGEKVQRLPEFSDEASPLIIKGAVKACIGWK